MSMLLYRFISVGLTILGLRLLQFAFQIIRFEGIKKPKAMKKQNLLMMLFAFFVMTSVSFASNNPGDEEPTYTIMTVKEIKAMYGESVQISESLNLSETDQVVMMNNPCAGEMPCGGALAAARAQAQQLANQCCCVRFYGVICCQPSTGSTIAIDGIVLPNSPQCN